MVPGKVLEVWLEVQLCPEEPRNQKSAVAVETLGLTLSPLERREIQRFP